jgi:hypothetical protein
MHPAGDGDGSRVIITGGSGLIGRAVAAELAGAGFQVVVLSRRPRPAQALGLPDRVAVTGWDGRSAQGWGQLADGARAIVNLAGASLAGGRWSAERKRLILDSRLHAGGAVLQAVEQAGRKPQVVIQASAVGYYGRRGDEEISEDSPAGEDFLAQVCLAWEASTQAVAGMGVRHVVIRTGIVLSAGEGALPRLALPFRLFLGGRLGSGRQWVSWIHLADEAAAIRFLIEQPAASGAFNLTAPQPVTNAEFGKILGQVLRRPAWLPAPAFALRLALGELATTVLDGQRVVPRRLLQLGFSFRFPQAAPALQDILA